MFVLNIFIVNKVLSVRFGDFLFNFYGSPVVAHVNILYQEFVP